jgi:hypothetical protein
VADEVKCCGTCRHWAEHPVRWHPATGTCAEASAYANGTKVTTRENSGTDCPCYERREAP